MTQDREQEILRNTRIICNIENILRSCLEFDDDGKEQLFNCYSGACEIFRAGYRKVAPELKETYNKGYQDGLAHNYTHRFDQRQIEGKV